METTQTTDTGWDTFLKRIRLYGFIRLLPYIRPSRRNILIAVASGISHNLFAISASALAAYLVGAALTGAGPEIIKPLLWALGALVTLRAAMYFSEMWFAHEAAFRILADLRLMLYQVVEQVAPAALLSARAGDMSSTLIADVEVLEWFFAHTAGTFLVAVAVPVIILIGEGLIHPLLPLVLLPCIFMVFSIPLWLRKKADQQGKETRDRLAEVNAETIDGVQGIREILSFTFERAFLSRLGHFSKSLYQSQIAYGKRLGAEGALLNAGVSLTVLCMLGVSAWLVIDGQLAAAWQPVVIILAVYVFSPVVELCSMGRNFGIILAAADRVFRVLESEPVVEDSGSRPVQGLKPVIGFEHVYFRYGENLPLILNDVSFRVEEGETVALVGDSGVGKTTCINLLQRFWDVQSGRISIDSVDIRELPLEQLRSLITMVPQEVYLFNTSLRENIRLGRPEASDAEVESAARAALIHDFITGLPDGYATSAGERGLQLSGGQKQRIAIARAIIKDAPILILDEAMSSLDTENERLVQASLNNLRHGRTTLIVAHRLSTFRNADRLVVLKDGRVEETDSHEELLRKGGYYSRFVSVQQKDAGAA
jgi:ATP-binding cassette subfamily C protein CydC